MLELFLIIVGFLAASGFMAMIDAAVLNVTHAEVEVLIARKYWGAKELKTLLNHTTRTIVIIVIFTNVTNILGPILAGRKAEDLFGSEAIGFITAFLTFATIIFSEIIPKSLGAHYAPRISRRIAPLLLALTYALFPIVLALEWIVKLFKTGKRKVGTEEQIRALANLGGGAGHIDSDERELIHRAFVLNDRKTREIMTPADKLVTIPDTVTVRQASTTIFTNHYSRYPVIGATLEDVRGYILNRDVLEALAYGRGETSIMTLVRPLPFVNGGLPCDELLNVLRKSVSHLVIVRENGKAAGLVTLEDVLEELVGEIRDEGDVEA